MNVIIRSWFRSDRNFAVIRRERGRNICYRIMIDTSRISIIVNTGGKPMVISITCLKISRKKNI